MLKSALPHVKISLEIASKIIEFMFNYFWLSVCVRVCNYGGGNRNK